MATTGKAVSANAVKNNGGTILAGGNVDTTGPITQVLGKDTLGAGSTQPTGVPAPTDTNGLAKAITTDGAAYATQQSRNFIVRGLDATLALLGTFSKSTASDWGGRKSVHYSVSRRSVHITAWNYATGAATYGSPTTDAFGDDHAATPTRVLPGEFAYMVNGKTPTQDDYDAKTI